MLIACWAAKGGSGTTVVSVALALLLARSSPRPVVIADLAGDVPAVLGLPESSGPGLADWLAAGPDVPQDALERLEVDVGNGLRLLPLGSHPHPSGDGGDGGDRLTAALAGGIVIADCGTGPAGAGLAVATAATLSLLVVRPCYLALRRALAAPLHPSGVVLVDERGRSLRPRDIEDVLGVPVRAEVPWDAGVARAVDAGTLASRLPGGLDRLDRVLQPLVREAA